MKTEIYQELIISKLVKYKGSYLTIKTIKYLINVLLLTFFLITSYSCKKEPKCACGVEHPEENLQWLKDNLSLAFNVDVYQYFFDNIEYIIISEPPGDDDVTMVFDCSGNLLCVEGGINPGANICNLPLHFWDNFEQNRVFIYQKKYTLDE